MPMMSEVCSSRAAMNGSGTPRAAHRAMRMCAATICILAFPYSDALLDAQNVPRGPRAELLLTNPPLKLTGDVDSNSPAIWQRAGGRETLFVMTSFAGKPSMATGRDLRLLGAASEVTIDPWPGGGVWMEAVVSDSN